MESPTLWNGQMEYPPARTSHTSDWNGQMESLQMDNSPAEGFPYSRLEWTDGMSTKLAVSHTSEDEAFYASQVVLKKVAVAQTSN